MHEPRRHDVRESRLVLPRPPDSIPVELGQAVHRLLLQLLGLVLAAIPEQGVRHLDCLLRMCSCEDEPQP
jgi:hypothetical protein